MSRKLVVFINAPNSSMVEPNSNALLTLEQAGAGDIPALGILTLGSAIRQLEGVHPVYLDGMACPFSQILDFISANKSEIIAICLSALSATYAAGLEILRHSRRENPKIIHIVGNDHFTALPDLCMTRQPELIDCGVIGNEVIGSLRRIVAAIASNSSWQPVPTPGLVFRDGNKIIKVPQRAEPLFTRIDYALMNETYNHSQHYDRAYRKLFPGLVREWFGNSVHRCMSVEIARGCIKFRDNNACSFCSIQYGGMWKNAVRSGGQAWEILHRAYQAGYDHLFITADELPLTFHELLLDMKATLPAWLLGLPKAERPILTGYARADGLCIEKNAKLLHELGFRFIYVGVDAGPTTSLLAFNKQFAGDPTARLESLYEANRLAFEQAYKVGLKVDVGFVLGHIGMTRELLSKNIELFRQLVTEHRNAISIADINLITPEPGSKDFSYLLYPEEAERKAYQLGLSIAPRKVREELANRWKDQDIMSFENQVTDYVTAFMPELTVSDLIHSRKEIHDICRENAIQDGYV